MSERTQRRLAAIVSADVVGYSRLVGADETGTLGALRAHRSELIDRLIGEHGGRIVKSMGDGLLLEFASVVDATQCAIAVQQGMAERNRNVHADRRIIFRIGINLGDIVIDGHAIRHLLQCESLAQEITDYRRFEAHDAYLTRLRTEHGRKSSFGSLLS